MQKRNWAAPHNRHRTLSQSHQHRLSNRRKCKQPDSTKVSQPIANNTKQQQKLKYLNGFTEKLGDKDKQTEKQSEEDEVITVLSSGDDDDEEDDDDDEEEDDDDDDDEEENKDSLDGTNDFCYNNKHC